MMEDGAIGEEEKPFPQATAEPGGGRSPSINDPSTPVTRALRACARSLLAPYRHAWIPLLPTEPLGARTALGTSRRGVGGWPQLGLAQAGPGTRSPTCSPLSPGMPGMPRAPGTDCPGGPLSPCKGHMIEMWLVPLEPPCAPQCHGCAAFPVPAPQGCPCRWGWGWVQTRPKINRVTTPQGPIPWTGGHKGGPQSQRAGRAQTELGHGSLCHQPFARSRDRALPSLWHLEGDWPPVVGTHLLALHAFGTSWSNTPWGTRGTRSTITTPGTGATNNAWGTLWESRG